MLEQKKTIVSIEGVPLHSFLQVMLKQTINDHHYFELQLNIEVGELYEAHTLEKSKDWVGKKVEIRFGENVFAGIVTHVGLHRSGGNHGYLQVSGYSSTFLLESELNCASWMNKTLSDIVKEVCDKAGVPSLINPEYKSKIEYECQYRECNFDFIRRLARQYREWLYYDGRQLIFGKPELPASVVLNYGREISALDVCVQAQARPVQGQSYHSGTAQTHNASTPDAPKGLNTLGQSAFDASIGLFKSPSTQHSEIRIANKSELDSYLQKKQQSDSASSHYITCESDCNRVALGGVVEIQTAIQVFQSIFTEKSLGEYIVTEITHVVTMGDNYRNSFTALSSSIPSLPSPNVPLPTAQTQQAVVFSNNDPEKQGRVQVKMNWQTGGMQTSWIRVLTPDAGMSDKVSTNRGFVFIPEKDDLVLVGFRYDDPNRPFVMGSLFNGKTGTGGDSGNKKKSLTTRSGCTITIDDDKGSVTMKDKEGNSYTADGEGNITVSASKSITLCVGDTSLVLDSDGNITSTAPSNISETAGADISQSASNNIDSSAKNAYNISGTDVSASGKTSATVSGGTKATVDSTGTTAIMGTIVKLN